MAEASLVKSTIPSVAEQLANPVGLSTEVAQLRALISEHSSLHFEPMHITQRLALAMLSLNFGNRRISRAWLQRLKRIIERGRFLLTHQAAAFDTNGYLRDGQHRLLAVAETGIAVDMPVAFGVDPAAFAAMDVGMRRSGAQSLELDGIKNASQVQAVLRLRHRVTKETSGEKLDDQGVYVLGLEACQANDLLQRAIGAGFRMQALAPVSAAAFAYWQIALHSPDRYRLGKFWDQLVEGYELDRGNPLLEARRLLGNARNASKKLHQSLQQTLSVVWIIWAWNEWTAGNTGGRPPRWTKVHEVLPVRGAPQ